MTSDKRRCDFEDADEPGRCTLGLWGGRPHVGVCRTHCRHFRDGTKKDSMPKRAPAGKRGPCAGCRGL